ncbi:uncharacterized protein LOC114724389 isoform X2 [Neltuma alba]|uniref:uncharacterized protein LOC114724389 isoform X2 n=1 Tax=Neltuma alba TaxID=207710 RepID=UPI0010A3E470|nr:uncharacterized protein LOC114724389 isoform X2 [Prosopis alba]
MASILLRPRRQRKKKLFRRMSKKRIKELQAWNKELDTELERGLNDLNSTAELLVTAMGKMNVLIRMKEIKKMVGDYLSNLRNSEALMDPENAQAEDALEQKEAMVKGLKELELKKKKLERDIGKVLRRSKTRKKSQREESETRGLRFSAKLHWLSSRSVCS